MSRKKAIIWLKHLAVLALMGIGVGHLNHSHQGQSHDESNPGYSSYVRVGKSSKRFKIWKGSAEAPLHFAMRANHLVHTQTYHCEANNISYSTLEIALSHTLGKVLSRFSISRIFKDGIFAQDYFFCGYCHQRSFLLFSILKRNGVESAVWGMRGHVLVRMDYNGKIYFVDPDYGVGPIELPDDPGLLRVVLHSHYNNAPQVNLDRLAKFFRRIYDPMGPPAHKPNSVRNMTRLAKYQKQFVKLANTVSWVFVLAGGIYWLRVFRRWRRRARERYE